MPPTYQRDRLALRAAIKDDLDSIIQIVHAGFPDDPEVYYRFPRRDEFLEDYLKWTRMEYQSYIEQDKKFVVHLIEARSGGSEGESVQKPVAIAVWDVAILTKAHDTDKGLDERREANEAHCRAFTEAAGESFRKYFAKYEEKQIHLWLLVTHPDYRRHGAGAMLTEWGLNAARERGWPTTVFASPMGELLHAHLGFQTVGTKVVQVQGEARKLTSAVMEKI